MTHPLRGSSEDETTFLKRMEDLSAGVGQACINADDLQTLVQLARRSHDVSYPFTPNWKLGPAESMAVKLSIALSRHIPNWPGATDEQLEAVAAEICE